MTDIKQQNDPLLFIKKCVQDKRIFWTYHVNMRMKNRSISREMIQHSVNSFEIIESYPEDRYLPGYLVYCMNNDLIFHVLFAIDYQYENIRVITAYYPDPAKWDRELKRRLYI